MQKTLIASEARYWKRCRDFLKPGDLPLHFQTRIDRGCPYDCGLCPDHEQHSCLALLEINETCNLTCPTGFAGSSPALTGQLPFETVERMLDALVLSEGEPDLVQISGGEPTLHPRLLDIIAAAKRRRVRHVMLNTNGLRLAAEPDLARRLAEPAPGFQVYLQFDALSRAALGTLRGVDLRRSRQPALENLERAGVSTTLVATVRKGVNDHEIGDVLRHAQGWSCVRGVNFQPVQDTGRNDGFDAGANRIVPDSDRRRRKALALFRPPLHCSMVDIGRFSGDDGSARRCGCWCWGRGRPGGISAAGWPRRGPTSPSWCARPGPSGWPATASSS